MKIITPTNLEPGHYYRTQPGKLDGSWRNAVSIIRHSGRVLVPQLYLVADNGPRAKRQWCRPSILPVQTLSANKRIEVTFSDPTKRGEEGPWLR